MAVEDDDSRSGSRTSLIETEAIIAAYGMSRLDKVFLKHFGYSSWSQAFRDVGNRLDVTPASIKNLRDEFDPVHQNSRRGWHKRPLRPNRLRVLGELCDASDDAVLEVITRILARDDEVKTLIAKPLAESRTSIANVAERLRTGRLAESFFRDNSEAICGVPAAHLIDCRDLACGFDFTVASRNAIAIEVKGIKALRGSILLTDLEWRQAKLRRTDFWLVVVGGIPDHPKARLFPDPVATLTVSSVLRRTAVISWSAAVSVDGRVLTTSNE